MPDPEALMDEMVDEALNAFLALLDASKKLHRLVWECNLPPNTVIGEMMKKLEAKAKKKGIDKDTFATIKRSFEAGMSRNLHEMADEHG